VEQKHQQPHLTETPAFEPRDGNPTIEVRCRSRTPNPAPILFPNALDRSARTLQMPPTQAHPRTPPYAWALMRRPSFERNLQILLGILQTGVSPSSTMSSPAKILVASVCACVPVRMCVWVCACACVFAI